MDKVNLMIDDLNAGKGTAGKLLKDPALYNNANDTIARVKRLTDDINAGKGAIGKMAKDENLPANCEIRWTSSPPSPIAWRRERERPGNCYAIRRCTTMPTRCWSKPAAW